MDGQAAGVALPNVCAEGPEPEWRLAREANEDSGRFADQMPFRWRSRSSEGPRYLVAQLDGSS